MWIYLAAGLAAANPSYDAGVTAMQEKDYGSATAFFTKCLRSEPGNADCHWELGWAHWMESDWGKVVEHWSKVSELDPGRKGLDTYLPQARDNKALDSLLSKGGENAPATFASNADPSAKLRIRAVGDMMIGTDFPTGPSGSKDYLPPDGGVGSFAAVKDLLQDADLTFGNLEGPLCDAGKTTKCKPGAPAGSCYAFRSPPAYAQIFKEAGFDMVSTANNHSGDFGQVCRLQTEEHLDSAGIAHSGRPGDIASLEVDGLKVAMIGFHTNKACHYVNDHGKAAALVRALATEHDIVLVSFHGGAEGSKALHVPNGQETFYGENRGHLREFSKAVIDAGADAVIGHGPHVLRGMEIYKGRLIAYSLGNFATYGRFSLSGNKGLGAILELELDAKGNFVGGKIFSTKQKGKGIPQMDAEDSAVNLIRMLSEEDFGDTAVEIAQDGTIKRP
jgi:hypothetical protein